MNSTQRKLLNKRDLLAYFLVAATGAIVQLISGRILRDYFVQAMSLTLAYGIAMVVGFILTKIFAFDAKGSNKTRREMIKFVIVSIIAGAVMVGIALVVTQIIFFVLGGNGLFPNPFDPTQRIKLYELIGHFAGMCCSFVINYIGNKIFTFKSSGFYDRLKAYIQ